MKKFYPKDGRQPIAVSSPKDITDYMGDLGNYLDDVENVNGLVIANIHGQPVTLGSIKDE